MRTLNQQSRAFKQRKGKDMMVSLVSLLITQRNNVSPYQTFPKSWGGKKKSHFHTPFIGSVLSSHKVRKRYHKKTKVQKNIHHKQSCKNSQENTGLLISYPHWKNLTQWINRIYPWDPRMFKHMKNLSIWYTTLRE